MLVDVPSSCIWSHKYFSALKFAIIISPIFIGLASASFNSSVRDSGVARIKNFDFDIFFLEITKKQQMSIIKV